MNPGQVVVLACAAAVLNAGPAAGTSRLGGYAITFSLLLVPTLLVTVLAVRARKTPPCPLSRVTRAAE